ncbi:MAG: hypothetical protein OXJ52_04745 [Oligoflexia bacterium]|nr:hypothetical protein [Oligoflexia bacterium]
MKLLILTLLSLIFLNPCLAEDITLKFYTNAFSDLKAGGVAFNAGLQEFAEGYGESPVYYVFSSGNENEQIAMKKGTALLIFPSSIKAGEKAFWSKQANVQELKGKIIRFRNNDISDRISWDEVSKVYMEAGFLPNEFEIKAGKVDMLSMGGAYMIDPGNGGGGPYKVLHRFNSPMSSYQIEQAGILENEAYAIGPGNGGGGPYKSQFYFRNPQKRLSQEKIQELAEKMGLGEEIITMAPVVSYAWNNPYEDLEVGIKRIYEGEVVLNNWWGGMYEGNLDKEFLREMLESPTLAKEIENTNAFSVYEVLNGEYDMEVLAQIPESVFREKAEMVYKGYGEMGEPVFQINDTTGEISGFSTGWFSSDSIDFFQ